ncbi:Tyrosinase [Smittium mucronatum]|uniref:Tyrosinase n=1 Tax=Smittium mucronatum TaxID=133383 RepID=A0A1R0H9M4_9FUNG|nr:Tyrosinase [Smittium mucronatum]
MKLSFSFALGALALLDTVNSQRCSNIITRKEIRTLSSSELNIYRSTLTQLYQLGWFDWFGFIHTRFFTPIHNSVEFLPWHRRFTIEFESLARYYNPNYVQHYWDGSIDSAAPANSPVLTDKYVGGNGQNGNGCITNGLQKGWINAVTGNVCLRRSFENNGNINPYQTPEHLTSDIQTASNFEEYRGWLEYGYHGQVHNSIGGDMAGTYSPLDALFFLHHSMIDRLWWRFQNAKPANLLSYSNDPSQQVTFYGTPVSNLLRVGYGFLCYQYDDIAALKRRDDSTTDNSSDIVSVIQTPDMNLATALNATALQKFFPQLANGSANPSSIAMPNVVSQTAVTYSRARNISTYRSPIAAASTNMSSNSSIIALSAEIISSVVEPVIDSINNSIADTLISTANSGDVGAAAGNTTVSTDKPKMAYPGRLSDAFIAHCNIDVAKYNAYYDRIVELTDLLNDSGYVSPYV